MIIGLANIIDIFIYEYGFEKWNILIMTKVNIHIRRRYRMPKDSQPDNKKARMEKAKGQTPLTRENQNQNRNAKKQSIENNDV